MAYSTSVLDFLKMTIGLSSMKIFVVYLLMIVLSGWWQRNTSPMNLKWPLVVHNLGCCFISVLTLVGFCAALYNHGSIYGKTHDPLLVAMFKFYWIAKIIELMDTVFMILRHRRRQISFLHVYHHASMLLLSDMAYHIYPWQSIASFLGINSLVHVILYLYYGLTALFPDKPPQWKREMTQIQILQFLIGFIIAGYGYCFHNFCLYSIFYGLTMMTLFSNFYYQAYIKRHKKLEINGKNGKMH